MLYTLYIFVFKFFQYINVHNFKVMILKQIIAIAIKQSLIDRLENRNKKNWKNQK